MLGGDVRRIHLAFSPAPLPPDDWQQTSLVVLHSFADERRTASVDVKVPHGECLLDLFDGESLAAATGSCTHVIHLPPYGST